MSGRDRRTSPDGAPRRLVFPDPAGFRQGTGRGARLGPQGLVIGLGRGQLEGRLISTRTQRR